MVVRERSLGLNPERFNSIQTPPIFTAEEQALANDGLPSYAQLDVLIAYLTAATTINYDTLNDFLITHKLFSDGMEVWNLVVSRLLWAADLAARTGSESEAGKNIGTRCFVLLRLWIREYFETDFVPNVELRSQVATTVTCLSGCTEFVLVDHFHRILEQLRKEWDTKVAKYWNLGDHVAGNVDSPVPIGGDPVEIPLARSVTRPRVLGHQIPIDANVSVPRIHTSPPKAKPRHKISMFFRKNINDHSTEVMLNSKADLLAMRIIDEYRQRELREFAPTPESLRSTVAASAQASDRGARNNNPVTVSADNHENLLENQKLAGRGENVSSGNFRADNDSRISSTDLSAGSMQLRSPMDQEDAQDLEPASTTSSSDVTVLRTNSASSSGNENYSNFELSTPATSVFEEDVWATPRRSPDTSCQWRPVSDVEPDNRTSQQSHPTLTHEQSMDTLNMNNMRLANISGESEAEMEMGLDSELSGIESTTFTVMSDTTDIPPTPNAPGTPTTLGASEMNSGSSIAFSDSNDGLATPVGQQTAPINLDYIDFDQFERISYAGSALSTLSSAPSTFSYHAANTARPNESPRFPSLSDDSISLISEIDNSQLLPCVGYTASDAAKLRAIPDLDVGEDALRNTLIRLEGNSSNPGLEIVTHMSRSNTIELYSQALESCEQQQSRENMLQNEISQLGISLNRTPPSRTPRSENSGGLASPFKSGAHYGSNNNKAANDFTEISVPVSNLCQRHGLLPFDTTSAQPDIPNPLPTLHIGLPGATHAPFILAFSARAVAEQMTIIECEILSQFDWTALVRMEWRRQPHKIYSWLSVIIDKPYLKGTELAAARFDLVYRWVQSEILLCPTPALQAQAICRFVQIAFESLKLRNFVTMVQLVRALCSIEVLSQFGSDLPKLLPQHDRETLERLEVLANPTQNYSKLRLAHDRYSWSKGCVPFTQMFLNDIELTAEAQSYNAEHEIHFGKYRTVSQIVKQLRRCVDSTTNYKLEVDPALLSKCLYLCALP